VTKLSATTRHRGFRDDYKPQHDTARRLDRIRFVLQEYKDHLPLTVRQVYYRLVAKFPSLYEKTPAVYAQLINDLDAGRRSRYIPFESIRDDSGTVAAVNMFSGIDSFRGAVVRAAEQYETDHQAGQDQVLEIWSEAAGMVPQLARVAEPYGVTVYSSSGFDSITLKYDAAVRMTRRDVPTVVLHVGDLDWSGKHIFTSAAEDVSAFVEGLGGDSPFLDAFLGGPDLPTFDRIALTTEQVEEYDLPRPPHGKEQYQAEALDPADLAGIVTAAIENYTDQEVLRGVLAEEAIERGLLVAEAEAFGS